MRLRLTLQALLATAAAGLGVSLYLAYSYSTGGTLACPDGGCAAVQHSPYAWIGPLPVPLLGALLYIALIGLAATALRWEERRESLLLALFGLSLAGVLFSGYLTYLEFFVIHAVCTWCLISALLTVLIFGLSLIAYREHP